MKIGLATENADTSSNPAIIKIIGVGGGGTNAVNRMIASNISGVEFIAVNTDAQSLKRSAAPMRVQIGERLTGGLGVGGNPLIGQKSAEESIEALRDIIKGADMVIVTAGMGGGTGTGAAPIVAQIARSENILTVAVVTQPFEHEGDVRSEQAEEGIKNLKSYTDALIVIPNENVFGIVSEFTMSEMFIIVDEVLRKTVQAITDVITVPGEINMDFADVRTILKNSGTALIGIGESAEENVAEAIKKAVTSSLLGDYDISGADKFLINITTSEKTSAVKLKEMGEIIKSFGISKAHIFYGHVIDNRLEGKIRITIIATGFKNDAPVKKENTVFGTPKQKDLFDTAGISVNNDDGVIDFEKPAYNSWSKKKLK